jgi:hypothetical protein
MAHEVQWVGGIPEVKRHADDEGEERKLTERERIEATFGGQEFDWEARVSGVILDEVYDWGTVMGIPEAQLDQVYQQVEADMLKDLRFGLIGEAEKRTRHMLDINDAQDVKTGRGTKIGGDWYTGTGEGFQAMLNRARGFIGSNTPIDFSIKPPSGGRGRAGARAPTAAEIRAQFDIKQLTESVNQMNRSMVLENHKSPKAVARAYVEAIVKTGGKSKIDFETYVKEGIKKTGRYKSIFRSMPEDMEPEDYLGAYAGAARGVVRPDEAADIAIGGAQFGATAEDFQQRLKRTEAVTGSAPFITGLESRMQGLKGLFKG